MRSAWVFWFLIVAFVLLLINRSAEIESVADLLLQGQVNWVLAAVLLQAAYYFLFATMFKQAFYTVEVASQVKDLLPVTLSSLFVNTVAPTWGMAGVALFIDDLVHRGQSPARATAGALLAQASDFIAFSFVLISGMIYLSLYQAIKAYIIFGAAILLLITFCLIGALFLGLLRPMLLGRILNQVQQAIKIVARKIGQQTPLEEDWSVRNARDFAWAARAIEDHPKRLVLTLATALTAHLANIASLYAIFLAFFRPIGFGPLVAGYAIGILFWNISPVPQGIGLVEGTMVLAYKSLGVPGFTATIIVLAFRGLDFWLPMLLGFFLLRRVRFFRPTDDIKDERW